jgi:serine/threonine-protein kinase
MSPEQCRGEPVDRRSDLFCVGILLYEMTTGRPAFRGDTEYMTCKLIAESEPERPTAIDASYPPALEAIVLRALSKDRRLRHATAAELQEDLARVARELQLDLSQFALGGYMAATFKRELDAWREAQRTGESLEQHVIRQTKPTAVAVPHPSEDASSPARSPSMVATIGGGRAIGSRATTRGLPARKRRTAIVVAAVVAAGAGGAIVWSTRDSVATKTPAGSASTPAVRTPAADPPQVMAPAVGPAPIPAAATPAAAPSAVEPSAPGPARKQPKTQRKRPRPPAAGSAQPKELGPDDIL